MRNLSQTNAYDAIVIGAGINGLVCAAVLAQARLRVIVLEAQDKTGGLCTTGELSTGHRVSTFAHWVGPFDPAVSRTLKLNKFGLSFSARRMSSHALSPDGRHIHLGDDMRLTAQSLAQHSAADAKAWSHFESWMRKAAQQLQRWTQEAPGHPPEPNAKAGFFGSKPIQKPALTLDPALTAQLDRSLSDVLDEEFETPLLKGAVAFEGLLGNALPPSAPATTLAAVLRRAIDVQNPDGLAHPTGGAGALTSAIQKSAEAAGVVVKTRARVAHLLFEAGKLAGVELQNGDAFYAPRIISSLDPVTTLLTLGAERELPLGLKRQLRQWRGEGCVAKVNLALSALPLFKGLDKKHLRDRLIISPSLDHLEKSWAACERGTFSSDIAIEVLLPTTHDAGLTTQGHHILSANVFYVPKTLAGSSWESGKAELVGLVGSILRQYAPDLPDQVIAADVYSPADIATVSGSSGGHWHGGDMVPTQLGVLRPHTNASRYATPVQGLFLCGSGTHPCGGLTGINGKNAAEAVLAAGARP